MRAKVTDSVTTGSRPAKRIRIAGPSCGLTILRALEAQANPVMGEAGFKGLGEGRWLFAPLRGRVLSAIAHWALVSEFPKFVAADQSL